MGSGSAGEGSPAVSWPQRLAAVMAACSMLCVPIAVHEGVINVGYLDPVNVATRCVGHTGPEVVVGKRYSDEVCTSDLASDLIKHGLEIDRCITREIPVESRAAFTSFAFNAGSAAFCRSTMARKLNAGDLAGACAELSRWVYAGGKKFKGLERRRADERALCEKGLA